MKGYPGGLILSFDIQKILLNNYFVLYHILLGEP